MEKNMVVSSSYIGNILKKILNFVNKCTVKCIGAE